MQLSAINTTQKLIGANLVPDPRRSVGVRRFEGMWSDVWDWDGWIKPQIDYLVGDCGCNVIRSIGGVYGISGGRVDAGQYRDRQLQIANYLLSKGAYWYPCGDSARPDTDYVTTASVMAAIYVSHLLPLQAVGNVIGFDILNEGNFGSFSKSYYTTLIAAIKAAGVTIPLTISTGEALTATAGATWINDKVELMDFVDIHNYTFPMVVTSLDYFLLGFPDKDLIIGEVGKNTTALSATGGGDGGSVVNDLQGVYKIALSGHPRVRGVLQWACADLENTASAGGDPSFGEWGVYDTNTTPGRFISKRHKVDLIRRFTHGSVALCGKP